MQGTSAKYEVNMKKVVTLKGYRMSCAIFPGVREDHCCL